jgi:hypothetical protein
MDNYRNQGENSRNSAQDQRLNELFLAYREACVEPEAGVNFMPGLWARVEARERSGNILGRMAKAVVTAALAASVVIGLVVTFEESNRPLNGTYIEAVTADHVSTLETFHLERISELEFQ